MLSSTVRIDAELRAPLLVADSQKPRQRNWCLISFYIHRSGVLFVTLILLFLLLSLGPLLIQNHPDLNVSTDKYYRAEMDFIHNIGISLHNTFGTLILSLASVSSIIALAAVAWIGKVAACRILKAVGVFMIALLMPFYVSGWVAIYHLVVGEPSNLRWRKEILYSIVFLAIFPYLRMAKFLADAIGRLKKSDLEQANDGSVMSDTDCREEFKFV